MLDDINGKHDQPNAPLELPPFQFVALHRESIVPDKPGQVED